MLTKEQKNIARDLYQSVQNELVRTLESVDGEGRFQIKEWERGESGGFG